ncbi:MAG: TIGR03960 family B12-binding radical SAM protein [Anaerolineales bacterium]|nr:TIGR03960 family B12-binding radical SAM protein [Anaerolineales bacterium]
MTNTQLLSTLEKILPSVQSPGRYTGGEFNQIVKAWETIDIHVALLFPEIYDLGMSNLGLMILYDLINQLPKFSAERAFLPWTDMEDAMRAESIPLYSLETKHPLSAFDILAVSLPYESLYTNLLNSLDLAGLPLYSSDRTNNHPLVIAGGHAVFNPEPVSPFIDAFVIGEGEEVIIEILDAYKSSQDQGHSRQQILENLSQVEGVYIPSFYQPHYQADGTFSHLEKLNQKAPDTIQKRIVGTLPPPPTKLIVPYIDTVHNRAPLEIMRGCTRGCRFCHAGIVTRPVRERSPEDILQAMEVLIPNTGYSEIGLLSLSSSDYTEIVELIQAINDRFLDQNIAVSLPSLRIESVSVDLMDALAGKRRSGFTLAPEAASERLRKIINKPISDQQLLDTAREIYQRGWHTIKLYFMIGHPSETMEDVQAIADLSRKVLAEGKKIIGNRSQVHISLGTFVPKPQTPFQWVGVDSQDEIKEKLDLLQKELRGRGLKLNWNDPEETQFEAWLSRGDRRIAEVIYRAWKMGAKFDAWNEHFNFQRWLDAFSQAGIDPAFYSIRERGIDENFPWDHIQSGVKKSFLLQDYEWSKKGKTRPDCREDCYACGILPTYNDLRHQNPGPLWLCPEVSR